MKSQVLAYVKGKASTNWLGDIFKTRTDKRSSIALLENWLNPVLNTLQFWRIPTIFSIFAEIQRTFKLLWKHCLGWSRKMVFLVFVNGPVLGRTNSFVLSGWVILSILRIFIWPTLVVGRARKEVEVVLLCHKMFPFWNKLSLYFSDAGSSMHPLALILSRFVFHVSDYFFVFSKLQSQFLFLFINSFVQVTDKMVEVVLSLQVCLAEHRWSHLIIVNGSWLLDSCVSFPFPVELWSFPFDIQLYLLSSSWGCLKIAPFYCSFFLASIGLTLRLFLHFLWKRIHHLSTGSIIVATLRVILFPDGFEFVQVVFLSHKDIPKLWNKI